MLPQPTCGTFQNGVASSLTSCTVLRASVAFTAEPEESTGVDPGSMGTCTKRSALVLAERAQGLTGVLSIREEEEESNCG